MAVPTTQPMASPSPSRPPAPSTAVSAALQTEVMPLALEAARFDTESSAPGPATGTTHGLGGSTRSFEGFRLALRDKNYAAARRWLHTNTVPLDTSVETLAASIVALGLDDAVTALEGLHTLNQAPHLPSAWLNDLTARSYGHSPDYLAHLPVLRRSDNFVNAFYVATRLLQDSKLQDCETFVNRAISLAGDFNARGQARFLRAQLRLAQQRPTLAVADLRWLALSNPHHGTSQRAFELLSVAPFQALTSDDLYLRANQLADHGLVDAVDGSVEALRPKLEGQAALADLEYLRGLARYRKRMFAEAIEPFDRAVELGSHKADHARYLAARATARAGNPKDAIERFQRIARGTPVTPTVGNAAFHIAREHSIAGNWEDAARAYGEFQARFPKHEYADLVEQDLLSVWFATGHYKRVVYWARQLREKDPERAESLLLRSIEALALAKLGHTDLATQMWRGLAQTSPLNFAGVVARQRLAQHGTTVHAPFNGVTLQHQRLEVPLPEAVTQLDALGFSRQAEFALKRQEPALVRNFAPRTDAALCDAYAHLRAGRRRFELGYEAVKRRGLRESPQLAEPWLWHCYYPTPFRDAVDRQTQFSPVSPALVYAVMRQESAFMETVKSSAGARGLMQLIDPTARRIAAELNRDYDPEDLDDPEHNIEFGMFYLNKLQKYFHHPALVAAAYNAGPEATARWFFAGRTLPLEVFVLRIPYAETRTYVQRVLANLAVYQALEPDLTRVTVDLEFASALDTAQSLPDVLNTTPEDFY